MFIVGHHHKLCTLLYASVKDTNGCDNAAIFIEIRIKNERFERSFWITRRRRDEVDNGFEQVVNAFSCFSGYEHRIICSNSKLIFYFLLNFRRMCRREINFVDSTHDIEICVHRKICVRNRLSFDSLRGVHDEDRAFARGKRARNFVGKIDMARRIDEIKFVGLTIIGLVTHANRIGLNRDAALALDIHAVEHLLRHIALRNGMRELQDAIRNGRFTMIYVRND